MKFLPGVFSATLIFMMAPGQDYKSGAEFAAQMDAADLLAGFRDKFFLPRQENGDEYIYFTGNSLGLQPRTAQKYVAQEMKDWERLAVAGHLQAKHPWLPYHEFLTEQMAEIVGATPRENVGMN